MADILDNNILADSDSVLRDEKETGENQNRMNENNPCDNCLCNLKRCKAECCKEFRIRSNPRQRLKKGDVIKIKNNDEDFELYAALRGFTSDKEYVNVVLNDFKQVGRYVFIYAKCALLTKEDKCSAHNGMFPRPKMCDYPNKNDDGKGRGIYLTPNCVFKK